MFSATAAVDTFGGRPEDGFVVIKLGGAELVAALGASTAAAGAVVSVVGVADAGVAVAALGALHWRRKRMKDSRPEAMRRRTMIGTVKGMTVRAAMPRVITVMAIVMMVR